MSDFSENIFFLQILGGGGEHNISRKCVHWEPSCSTRTGGRADGRTDGRTDGQTHDEANNRFSQVCEEA